MYKLAVLNIESISLQKKEKKEILQVIDAVKGHFH